MKNNIIKLVLIFFFFINLITPSNAEEQFNFEVSVIDITENGNLITGSEGGTVITNNGIEVIAEKFIYDKITNILKAFGNVKLVNTNDNSKIYSDKVTYLKNEEIIFTEGNSKAINEQNVITASNFKFNKIKNIINAEKNVKFVDKKKDTIIFSDKVTYLKNEEIIFTEGETSAFLENKYEFTSKNVQYSRINQDLKSDKHSLIKDDNGNVYELENFVYLIDKKILKGNNVNVLSKVDENKTDNYFFSEGVFNFNKNSFISKDTKIKIHKKVFNNEEQDPRIYGVSSSGDENKTIILLVDFEGHPDNPSVKLALEEMKFFSKHLKILGVYKKSTFRKK